MRKILFLFLVLIFSGCTRLYNSNEVSLNEVNTFLTYQTGVVEDVKSVIIKDDGSGVAVGMVTGTVVGSMFGRGKGNLLSTLIGGIAGAMAGYELDKANAQEVFIRLDDSREIVAIVKGVNLKRGDRVRVVIRGDKIVRVEKI